MISDESARAYVSDLRRLVYECNEAAKAALEQCRQDLKMRDSNAFAKHNELATKHISAAEAYYEAREMFSRRLEAESNDDA